MPVPSLDLELQPASLDDATLVAGLDLRCEPDADADPVRMRHWWARSSVVGPVRRMVAVRGGEAVAFVAAGHDHWKDGAKRFGWVRVALDPSVWTEQGLRELIAGAERWLRDEGATAVALRVSDRLASDIAVAQEMGYAEARRARVSELDIAAHREELMAARERYRASMAAQGVAMHTLVDDADAKLYVKLYAMAIETEQDIPTTTPLPVLSLEDWKRTWFDDPGVHKDRFWIAREKDDIVGLSVLDFPIVSGVPFTSYTATARRARGRGIARALKYETVAQALDLGYTRIRTQNDGDNEPMLHINEAMGYEPVHYKLELHRELA